MSTQDLAKESITPSGYRQAVSSFLATASKYPKTNYTPHKPQLYTLVQKYQNQTTVEPESNRLALFISELELADSQLLEAAKALKMIKFRSVNSGLSPKERIEIQLKICEYCVAAKDFNLAEDSYKNLQFVKFANIDGMNAQEAQLAEIRYKIIHAQYLRSVGRHSDAGLIYLGFIGHQKLQDFPVQKDKAIESAIVCVVLAQQSQKKTSLLANIYQNQTVKKHPMFEFVERVLFGNVITKQESFTIKDKLTVSQQKQDEDGLTPLQKAVFQHNIRCLLKVYQDISFKTLEELLGIPNNVSFFIQLQKMIEHGLPAQIDQVQEFVTFMPNDASEKSYTQRITVYCDSLERFIEANQK